nr:transposase [Thermaerobacter marianensis]
MAAYGYSRDKRPDRPQLVVGVLMTRDGYPIAHEVFPGDTADRATVASVLDVLKRRFHLHRVIFVADRGMVSRRILRAESILGMPLRRHREAEAVLSQPGRYRVIDEQLRIKQVIHQGQRDILSHNPLQAEHDRQARVTVLEVLQHRIERGEAKQLLCNRLVARYLKTLPQGALVVDSEAIQRAARYDGKYLLRTNTDLEPEAVVRAYMDLWRVERAFRTLKSALDLRPMFHWMEWRVRGHVMVGFLALVLESLLLRKLRQQNPEASCEDVLSDLAQLHAAAVELDGETYLTRTELVG